MEGDVATRTSSLNLITSPIRPAKRASDRASASKLVAERYAYVYHEVYDVSAEVLRYFTVYGPRMLPIMTISNFVSWCINGDPPVIYGDGTQTQALIFIENVLAANRTLQGPTPSTERP